MSNDGTVVHLTPRQISITVRLSNILTPFNSAL